MYVIKPDDNSKHIPIIILTGSEVQADIRQTYRSHANCYITKPMDLDNYIGIIEEIEQFWFSVVKLPGQELS